MENFFQVEVFTREECDLILQMPRRSQDRSTLGESYEESWINGKSGKGIIDTFIVAEQWVLDKIDSVSKQQKYANISGCWPLIYKEYPSGSHVGYHTDGVRGVKRVGVSISLNDEYTGGKLQFADWRYGDYAIDVIKNIEIDTPPGTATVFPIFIPHRVTPITSGTRKQLVTWLTGEKLNW